MSDKCLIPAGSFAIGDTKMQMTVGLAPMHVKVEERRAATTTTGAYFSAYLCKFTLIGTMEDLCRTLGCVGDRH
jgi:hypothetical protein